MTTVANLIRSSAILSRTESACRSCGSSSLSPVLDLGETPLADRLVPPSELDEPELRFPLNVVFCSDCTMVQITETVRPEILYTDAYPYYSSFSPTVVEYARQNAVARIAELDLGADSLAIEIASNDGYLLKNYIEAGVPVLGVDPAQGPAASAESIGVPTVCEFFTDQLAERLAAEGKQADVIHGNNVLAHVEDINGFVSGVARLLKPHGVAVFEAPYVKSLVEGLEFDTIYHEHHCYFSVTALDRLFRRHRLFLHRIEHLPVHGGSLRMFVGATEDQDESVRNALADESTSGMVSGAFYRKFAEHVCALKADLTALIGDLKRQGKSVAAYGAAAKGATLLNFCGLSVDEIDFVVDRNVHKHGSFMPGSRIPIRPPSALAEDQPDYALLLAWNYADEVMAQQSEYRSAGGRFIIPVPSPRIV